jgi:hypothetical protein
MATTRGHDAPIARRRLLQFAQAVEARHPLGMVLESVARGLVDQAVGGNLEIHALAGRSDVAVGVDDEAAAGGIELDRPAAIDVVALPVAHQAFVLRVQLNDAWSHEVRDLLERRVRWCGCACRRGDHGHAQRGGGDEAGEVRERRATAGDAGHDSPPCSTAWQRRATERARVDLPGGVPASPRCEAVHT